MARGRFHNVRFGHVNLTVLACRIKSYGPQFLLTEIVMNVQSNLVISNSLISNYRLSRNENLVPVLT